MTPVISSVRCFAAALAMSATLACTSSSGARGDSTTAANAPAAGSTLRAIRARGAVKCGISQAAGFATPNDAGQWQGFDVDFCKALAVAVLGDTAKVEFVPYTQSQRFSGLQSGEVDVLVNGTSLTSSRALLRGFHFGPVYLYDGQAFLVPKSLNVSKAATLDGATVCVQQGTTTELNLTDFARRNNIKFRPVVIEDHRGAVAALAAGRCDVITQDGAGLATTRTMLRNPDDYVVLPDRISKEPIAPVVRYGDDQWLEVVNWVFRAPVQAEQPVFLDALKLRARAGAPPHGGVTLVLCEHDHRNGRRRCAGRVVAAPLGPEQFGDCPARRLGGVLTRCVHRGLPARVKG